MVRQKEPAARILGAPLIFRWAPLMDVCISGAIALSTMRCGPGAARPGLGFSWALSQHARFWRDSVFASTAKRLDTCPTYGVCTGNVRLRARIQTGFWSLRAMWPATIHKSG